MTVITRIKYLFVSQPLALYHDAHFGEKQTSFSMLEQPNSGPGCLIIEVSRSHTITHTHTHTHTHTCSKISLND
jgi:hypothetical protein